MCKFTTNADLDPPLENVVGVFSGTGRYATNQFNVDVIFGNMMKQYECLTHDSYIAAAIFVPFYAGFAFILAVNYVMAVAFQVGNEKIVLEEKLCRQDRIKLGQLFQGAMSSHNWELAVSLILVADPQTLNDALCVTLDSIWFLSSELELNGITGFIKKIIANGAYDFTRVALRTSFLASCVSACQSRTMSLADTVTVMA
ncbi:ankyrin repeat protein SKIP35 isoform X1 [Sesbania bispinosa]|nr:ankyrin repeat protein SKIP35 isoform X1 [Sesbania bispinosa]